MMEGLLLVLVYIMKIIKDKNEAIKVLLNQKPLVIFQGESEWGPRALGNRSILFDARNKDAKNIVNEYKQREWWRPLAGTVLLEHANEYFDLHNIDESPYMSFAIDAKKKELAQLELTKMKEFNEAAVKLFNQIDGIDGLEQEYYSALTDAATAEDNLSDSGK